MMYTQGSTGVDYPGGLPGYTTGKSLSSHPKIDLSALSARGGSISLVVTAADGKRRRTSSPSSGTGRASTAGSRGAATAMRGSAGELYGADDPLPTR